MPDASSFVLQVVKDLLRMNLCLDFLRYKYLLDNTLPVHKICGTERPHRLMAAGNFLTPAAKSLQKLGGSVSDKRELQSILLRKLCLGILLVLGNTYYGIPRSLKLRFMRL